jgi:1-acyl-sn-glycerol-3-phosphate acyltransferase
MHSPIKAVRRLFLFVLWTLVLTVPQYLLVRFRPQSSYARKIPKRYHRVAARIVGLDVKVRGRISRERPTLFVSNHLSYMDIPVLGSLIEGSFVAKTEVGTWPGFGTLARLQQTVFVNRAKRASSAEQRDSMIGRLKSGDNLILFPEGTSSDGNRTLPFKSALFAVASMEIDGKPLCVQPVTISCTHLDGIPIGRWLRPVYAWYGDMELPSHIWQLTGTGKLRVQVQFHAPMTVQDVGSRKALATACWQKISLGLSAANAGRTLPRPGASPATPAVADDSGTNQPVTA